MSRDLHPPYRWNAQALTPVGVTAIRVLDTERGLKLELYGPNHGGERLLQAVDVPFSPSAQHVDCITITDADAKAAAACAAAVDAATEEVRAQLETAMRRLEVMSVDNNALQNTAAVQRGASSARIAELEKENDALKRQLAALRALVAVAVEIDRAEILLRARPAFGHQLRVALKAYHDGKFPAYVTAQEHADALAKRDQSHEAALTRRVSETASRYVAVLQVCARRLSDANLSDPGFNVDVQLKQIDAVLAATGVKEQ